MKSNQLLKHLFATTAVLATLTTTAVTTTAHADDNNTGSAITGVSSQQMTQYGIDHGYINSDHSTNQSAAPVGKTTIDAKTKKMGYDVTKMPSTVYPNAEMINQYGPTLTSLTTMYSINGSKPDNPNIYTRGYRILFLDGLDVTQSNYKNQNETTFKILSNKRVTQNPNLITVMHYRALMFSFSHQNIKYRPWTPSTYINTAKLFKIWLHADYNKMFTAKQPKNWTKAYLKKEPNVMLDGYKTSYMTNKILWAQAHPAESGKQLKALSKRVILKDQRTSSAQNDFDDLTTIEK